MIAITERLEIRKVTTDDADFFLQILNDPGFIEYIGDRGVRTIDQSRDYIQNRALASFEHYGFGPYVVQRKEDKQRCGLCTLVKREGLEDADIGFAFLPEYCGQGYAYESSLAVLNYAKDELRLPKIVAITRPDNSRSISLVQKLGLTFQERVQLDEGSDPVNLFVMNFEPN